MFALILESIGGTELLFILAIALMFFGPRKLPQLARSMGKGLSEFRKASDDFKRTWEREVALEEAKHQESPSMDEPQALPDGENQTILNEPQLEPADPERVVARETAPQTVPEPTPEAVPVPAEAGPPEPPRKHEWL